MLQSQGRRVLEDLTNSCSGGNAPSSKPGLAVLQKQDPAHHASSLTQETGVSLPQLQECDLQFPRELLAPSSYDQDAVEEWDLEPLCSLPVLSPAHPLDATASQLIDFIEEELIHQSSSRDDRHASFEDNDRTVSLSAQIAAVSLEPQGQEQRTADKQCTTPPLSPPKQNFEPSPVSKAISNLRIRGVPVVSPSRLQAQWFRVLGSGASAPVVRGTFQGRAVAVKTFDLEEVQDQELRKQRVENFESEARFGFQASRRAQRGLLSNVAQTLATCRETPSQATAACKLHLVMELIQGQDLKDFILRPQFWRPQSGGKSAYCIEDNTGMQWEYCMPRLLKLKLASAILKGIIEIHSAGILHCDIKPENVMIECGDLCADSSGQDMKVKILDFGLSKPNDDDEQVSAGTPGYEAPEMEEWGEVTEKCDIYSYGRTMSELWTGSLMGDLDPEGIDQCSSLCSTLSQTDGRMAKTLEYLNWESFSSEVERILVHDHKVGHLIARSLSTQPEYRLSSRVLLKKVDRILSRELAGLS